MVGPFINCVTTLGYSLVQKRQHLINQLKNKVHNSLQIAENTKSEEKAFNRLQVCDLFLKEKWRKSMDKRCMCTGNFLDFLRLSF